MRRVVGLILSLCAWSAADALPANAQGYTPKGPIEAKYIAAGPWAVTETTTTQICDREGNVCRIFYPAQLGTNPLRQMSQGFRHPVIAWANGTNGPTSQYLGLLRHWASWGFIVVATADLGTETGETVVDATNYLIGLSNNPTSPFYGKVDAARIGVSGHSQGAGTTTHLFSNRGDLFKVAVPYATPGVALGIVKNWTNPLTLLGLNSGSILYMSGSADIVSEPYSMMVYYLTTSNSVTKGLGLIAHAGHEDLVNDAFCGNGYCDIGKGYPTAMFMWKLQDAADGPAAFRSGTGEFTRQHAEWQTNITNVQ